MLITTSYEPTTEMIVRAMRLADQWQGKWVPRQKYAIHKLRQMYGIDPVLIVSANDLRYLVGETDVFFHPSTALIRVKRLMRGEQDVLMSISGVEHGMSILDCTAGLAADALVFAYRVGPDGKVVALESEPVTSLLLTEGLGNYVSDLHELNEAMRRIQVQHCDHRTYLQQLPDDSFDIVYFDPMFQRPIAESSAISPLRKLANDLPISLDAIREAKRVARSTVVMKEHKHSRQFKQLGFTQITCSGSKIAYGVYHR